MRVCCCCCDDRSVAACTDCLVLWLFAHWQSLLCISYLCGISCCARAALDAVVPYQAPAVHCVCVCCTLSPVCVLHLLSLCFRLHCAACWRGGVGHTFRMQPGGLLLPAAACAAAQHLLCHCAVHHRPARSTPGLAEQAAMRLAHPMLARPACTTVHSFSPCQLLCVFCVHCIACLTCRAVRSLALAAALAGLVCCGRKDAVRSSRKSCSPALSPACHARAHADPSVVFVCQNTACWMGGGGRGVAADRLPAFVPTRRCAAVCMPGVASSGQAAQAPALLLQHLLRRASAALYCTTWESCAPVARMT